MAAAGKVANGIVNGAYEATRFKAKPNLPTLESGRAAAAAPWVLPGWLATTLYRALVGMAMTLALAPEGKGKCGNGQPVPP